MVKFGVFTKPWPEPSIEDLADSVARFGFDGIELPVRPGFQVEPADAEWKLKAAVEAFEARGLRVFSVAGPLEERLMHACGDCGVPILRTMGEIRRGEYRASEDRLVSTLTAAAKQAESARIKIGVQEHSGDYLSSGIALRHVLERVASPQVGAIWDAAHDALAGQEPESSLDLLWDQLLMVNLKNAFYLRTNGPEAKQAAWRRYFTSGPQGMASWSRAIDELKRRGYDGVICLTAEYDVMTDVDRLVEEDLVYARRLLDDSVPAVS